MGIVMDGDTLTATFDGSFDAPPEASVEIVEHIVAESPSRVVLVCDLASPGDSWPAALENRTLPSVTAFVFDTYFQPLTRQGINDPGDLAATLAACPALEQMFATGQLALSPCTHARLRTLHLLGDPLHEDLLEGLGGCRFPRLEVLALALASDAAPGPEAAAFAAIGQLHAPMLRELHITGGESIESALEAAARLPAHLTELVVQATIDDEDELVDIIERHASHLRRFGAIALPFSDYCSDEALVRARALVPAMTDSTTSAFLPAAYADW